MKNPVVVGEAGHLNGHPFYSVRLDARAAASLRQELEARAKRPRAWFTLIATAENPNRLRFKDDPTPEFEQSAPPLSMRGEVFRISGSEGKSCNLTLSSLAAGELAQRLAAAESRMREWVEIRVPSRRRDLVEIVPDVDAARPPVPDDEALGRAGAALSGTTLPADDFSDWAA